MALMIFWIILGSLI